MKNFLTIRDEDLGLDIVSRGERRERQAARAIVFDLDQNVALLHVTKNKYHKLPGGGLEEGEDIETALRREVMEEIGCQIKNIRDLGEIEEFRNKFDLHQVSYCFLADLDGEKGLPHFEQDEIDDGFRPVWLDLDMAIKLLGDEAGVEEYEGKFIQKRDLVFLLEAKKKIEES